MVHTSGLEAMVGRVHDKATPSKDLVPPAAREDYTMLTNLVGEEEMRWWQVQRSFVYIPT